MIFQEKQIILKNGKIAILKSPTTEDAKQMLNYISTACGETDFLARYPEEWENMSVEKEEAWIKESLNTPNALILNCLVDGKIAGNCEIRFRTGIKTSHRATVAIAILKKYWNIGIGSAMFEELIKSAREHGGVDLIELGFIEGNDRARHLYEKFGFKIVSETPNAFKLKDGTRFKEFYMQKEL